MDEKKKSGYIKLFRTTKDSEFWREMPFSTGKLWFWLLLEATHSGNKEKRHLELGQLDHSIRFILDAMEWYDRDKHRTMKPSPRTLYRALTTLRDKGQITLFTRPGVKTVITICNWEIYQSEIDRHADSDGNSDGNKHETLPPPSLPHEKKYVLTPRARVKNPMSLSEADLRPPASDYDEKAIFQFYLELKKKYHRRMQDMEVRHAIKVLHGDPTIEPRLTADDIKDIIENWLQYGLPLKPHGLFEPHSKFDCTVWEACLHFARSSSQNHQPKPELPGNQRKETTEEFLARRRQKREQS